LTIQKIHICLLSLILIEISMYLLYKLMLKMLKSRYKKFLATLFCPIFNFIQLKQSLNKMMFRLQSKKNQFNSKNSSKIT
jgi:hypothetical protein